LLLLGACAPAATTQSLLGPEPFRVPVETPVPMPTLVPTLALVPPPTPEQLLTNAVVGNCTRLTSPHGKVQFVWLVQQGSQANWELGGRPTISAGQGSIVKEDTYNVLVEPSSPLKARIMYDAQGKPKGVSLQSRAEWRVEMLSDCSSIQ
jgi:hypothetical protein